VTLHISDKRYESYIVLGGVNLFTLWKKDNQAFSKQFFFCLFRFFVCGTATEG